VGPAIFELHQVNGPFPTACPTKNFPGRPPLAPTSHRRSGSPGAEMGRLICFDGVGASAEVPACPGSLEAWAGPGPATNEI